MYAINPSSFPPKLTEMLLFRGTGLPPLDWNLGANRIARDMLAKVDDGVLFGKPDLASAGMASATRALLYLWYGCSSDCMNVLRSAPPAEQSYLEALCVRQANDAPKAKGLLRLVGDYPTYQELSALALRLIGDRTDPLLVRFRQMLEMTQSWEPHLFADLYEQARGGKLDGPAEEAVRQIQCAEFELLLRHCYEAAIGGRTEVRPAKPRQVDPQENLDRMRRLSEKHRPKKPSKEKAKTSASVKKEEPAPEACPATGIRVACPKCRSLLSLPATARGEIERCGKCQAAFRVPGESGSGGGATASSTPQKTFSLRCPKCSATLALPETARGAVERCGKCGTKFMAPGKQTAGAAR